MNSWSIIIRRTEIRHPFDFDVDRSFLVSVYLTLAIIENVIGSFVLQPGNVFASHLTLDHLYSFTRAGQQDMLYLILPDGFKLWPLPEP